MTAIVSLSFPFESPSQDASSSIRVWLLGSGSSGNACYVESGTFGILIDCGLAPLTLKRRLREIGRAIDQVNHIFLTHEHADHAGGLPKLMEKHTHLSVYATKETGRAVHNEHRIDRLRPLRSREPIDVGPFRVTPVPVPHDAAEPVAYRVEAEGLAFGYLTDLGSTTGMLVDHFWNVETLICEANHDLARLRSGPYPHFLKQRVSSDVGHLNNDQCAAFVSRIAEQGRLSQVVLAHLSEINNTPDLAFSTVRAELDACGAETVSVACARRKEVSDPVIIRRPAY